VKLALVEARPQRNLGLETQFAQARIAVEIGDSLPWPVERVTVRFLLRHRLGQDHFAHEEILRPGRRHRAQIDHRVEKSPRRAQQAELQREELPVGWKVRKHEALGVESPALGIGAVEGERGASDRHAALDHRRELQLVARACFMRRHGPGSGLRGEVVGRRR